MPHIHTHPNQHDMTVSAYIVREQASEWLCLVHMHRKIDKLMQIGGHIELDETPWQAMAKELREESGYDLSELSVLQPSSHALAMRYGVVHPVPFLVNTHNVGNEHYHSDSCFGFVAQKQSSKQPGEKESEDLRWCSLEELRDLAKDGVALVDVVDIYEFLLSITSTYAAIPAANFSLGKPAQGLTYKR